jgi:hypothetical protein
LVPVARDVDKKTFFFNLNFIGNKNKNPFELLTFFDSSDKKVELLRAFE